LAHIRDWQICASIDGTGKIGEYIRTGLDYETFCRNFEAGLQHQQHRRQMRLDFTLTLPGLFEVEAMQQLANRYGVEMLAKVVFGFSPDIVMSPLALPRSILERKVQELLPITTGAMHDVLQQLLNRSTFEEQWPDAYNESIARGKQRILKLESIRQQSITFEEICQQDKEIYEWWKNIRPANN
jgi:hypothetical protein